MISSNDMKFVTGDTDKKKFRSIDRVFTRFSRRLHKTVTGVITPYPVSNYVPSVSAPGGDVLRYMFPIGGTITTGMIMVGELPKVPVMIETVLLRKIDAIAEKVPLTRKGATMDLDVRVNPGDRIIVSLSMSEPIREAPVAVILDIWTSFIWTPNVTAKSMRKIPIAELEEEVGL